RHHGEHEAVGHHRLLEVGGDPHRVRQLEVGEVVRVAPFSLSRRGEAGVARPEAHLVTVVAEQPGDGRAPGASAEHRDSRVLRRWRHGKRLASVVGWHSAFASAMSRRRLREGGPMPVYVYRNLKTNETFEYEQRITEDALTVDPRTGD